MRISVPTSINILRILLLLQITLFQMACQETVGNQPTLENEPVISDSNSADSEATPSVLRESPLETEPEPINSVGTINGNPFGLGAVSLNVNDEPIPSGTHLILYPTDTLLCGIENPDSLDLPQGASVRFKMKVGNPQSTDPVGVFIYSLSEPLIAKEISPYLPGIILCAAYVVDYNGRILERLLSATYEAEMAVE